MDMAGVKTVDILVGVIVVLQCVGNAQAEITTSNGKNINLNKSESLMVKCVLRFSSSVTGGVFFFCTLHSCIKPLFSYLNEAVCERQTR